MRGDGERRKHLTIEADSMEKCAKLDTYQEKLTSHGVGAKLRHSANDRANILNRTKIWIYYLHSG